MFDLHLGGEVKWPWLGSDNPDTPRSGKTPPPPDTSAQFRHISQSEVEIVYSRSNVYRVIVAQDERSLFRLHAERWDTDDWDVGSSPHWCPYGAGVSITDTLANARKLASEKLALVEPPESEDRDVEQ